MLSPFLHQWNGVKELAERDKHDSTVSETPQGNFKSLVTLASSVPHAFSNGFSTNTHFLIVKQVSLLVCLSARSSFNST